MLLSVSKQYYSFKTYFADNIAMSTEWLLSCSIKYSKIKKKLELIPKQLRLGRIIWIQFNTVSVVATARIINRT